MSRTLVKLKSKKLTEHTYEDRATRTVYVWPPGGVLEVPEHVAQVIEGGHPMLFERVSTRTVHEQDIAAEEARELAKLDPADICLVRYSGGGEFRWEDREAGPSMGFHLRRSYVFNARRREMWVSPRVAEFISNARPGEFEVIREREGAAV